MHPYSVDSDERRVVPFYLAIAALAVTFAMRALLQRCDVDAGNAYTPSAFVVYGLLYVAFDRVLWKFSPLHRFGAVRVPDLNGVWEGDLRSSQSKLQKPHEVRLRVHQTWSTVLLTLESDRSISRSKMASFTKISPSDFELRWEYQAEAKSPLSSANFSHRGVTLLRLATRGPTVMGNIKGDYYTQHGRDSNGTVSLRRTS
jgi:hypothetical protein